MSPLSFLSRKLSNFCLIHEMQFCEDCFSPLLSSLGKGTYPEATRRRNEMCTLLQFLFNCTVRDLVEKTQPEPICEFSLKL